jgi:hypothetical protein
VGQLRQKYLELFCESTNAANKDYLFKRLAWRIQSLAEGTLSERARLRAKELAHDADIRMTSPRTMQVSAKPATRAVCLPAPKNTHDRLPLPGTILTRMYRGQRVEVKVLSKGFDYQGQVYRSLTAVAQAVTGSHWNGLLFFGLTGAGKERP